MAFTQCILTHITAHEAAYKAGILHRDLSPGNIMLVDDPEANIKDGMLIDWDLSKFINPDDKPDVARRITRTVSTVSRTVCLLSS